MSLLTPHCIPFLLHQSVNLMDIPFYRFVQLLTPMQVYTANYTASQLTYWLYHFVPILAPRMFIPKISQPVDARSGFSATGGLYRQLVLRSMNLLGLPFGHFYRF